MVIVHDLPLDCRERRAVTGNTIDNDWVVNSQVLQTLHPDGLSLLEVFVRDRQVLRWRWNLLHGEPQNGRCVAQNMTSTSMRTPTFPVVIDGFWRLCDNVDHPSIRGNHGKLLSLAI